MGDDQGYRDLAARERRRERGFRLGVGAVGLGVVGLVLGWALGWDGSESERLWSGWVMAAGAALTVAGAPLAWSRRPGEEARRLDATLTRRDRTQRERNTLLVFGPAMTVIILTVGLPGLWRILQDRGDFGDLLWVLLAAVYAWLIPMTLLGVGQWSRQNRKWLEDELTREWRGRALSLGFVVLLAGMTALYLIGLWRPAWAMMGFPLVLTGSSAVVGLRFLWLDHQAEAGGE